METIGIIAGGGQFPLLNCRAAKEQGYGVVVAALAGEADPDLEAQADQTVWFKLGQLGKLIKTFQRAQARRVILAGSFTKPKIFSGRFSPDAKFLAVLPQVVSLHDDALLRKLAEIMAQEGVEVVDSTLLLPELRTPAGVLSRRRPTKRELADARYGFKLAKELGRFDIGQCLVVRSRAVLAVEAMEGTDETIRRGGKLGGGRAMVVKVAKPNQDLRFDLPCVGVGTIQAMTESGCVCLVVEAERTISFDRAALLALADDKGVAVLALAEEAA